MNRHLEDTERLARALCTVLRRRDDQHGRWDHVEPCTACVHTARDLQAELAPAPRLQ